MIFQLKLLNEDKTDAYVTYQDLRSVARFKNQTVLAIKAPPEAKLHVPHPSEGLQIYMQSDRGEIEVYLCQVLKVSRITKSSRSFTLHTNFPSFYSILPNSNRVFIRTSVFKASLWQ